MRALIQRVSQASVTVDNQTIGTIKHGVLVLLGIETSDTAAEIPWLVGKIARLRIFDDADGVMNHSLTDTAGDALVISQFTLHASTKKGNRPSYIRAARPGQAEPLYLQFCQALSAELTRPVATGKFGADMQVTLTNAGPVTILIDTQNKE
ncbi:MAG: D-aminoacyl-tRNA deacylase [Verrucomicrobiales bacterium]|nr:D-aminoacyl-tRNA deacylase [Verrucomicrobiales bacterium]